MYLERVTGGLLLAGFVTFLIGGLMFVARGGLDDARTPSATYLISERGFIMSAVVVTALGFGLMEELLRAGGDTVFARLGSTTFLIAAVVLVTAEVMGLRRGDQVYGLIVTYVVLAFVGQALIGASVLTTDLLPEWIGWASIGWSIGWLILLIVVSRRDVYFPVLHHVIPLVIGVSLLVSPGA